MSKLCITLPPFAPDYSGAASALYELGGMIVIHDAAGCTGNYLGFDEPRSFASRSLVYCSGLRHMDAVMGNDKKMIDKILMAAKDLRPRFLAVLGSPVPMVIGTDFVGIASELEVQSGIPSVGIPTNGLSYYGKGSFLAWRAVLDKFAGLGNRKSGKGKGGTDETKKTREREGKQSRGEKTVNILGITPLDFYTPPDKPSYQSQLLKILEKHSYRVLSVFGSFPEPEKLGQSLEADVNVALSHSGYLLARHMKEKYGIPFVTGTPVGDGRRVLDTLKDFFEGGKKEPEGEAAKAARIQEPKSEGKSESEAKSESGEKSESEAASMPDRLSSPREDAVLIVGEQIIGNGIRDYLQEKNPKMPVSVASLFDFEKDLAREGDVRVKNEKMLREILHQGGCKTILGDPMIHRLVRDSSVRCISLPHVAVSSKIHWKECISYLGDEFCERMESVLQF